MKKIPFFSFIILLLLSCGNYGSNSLNQESLTTASNDPKIQEGLSLVASNDCFSCHKVADKMVGPSYKSVAEKYMNTENNRKNLAEKIIKGGSGNWGTLPMSPHPRISFIEAEKMV